MSYAVLVWQWNELTPHVCFIFVFVIVCLKKYAKGQELFMKVCDHLNLLEKDYYGVAIWETATLKVSDCLITFCVTFISFVNLAGTTYS